MNTTQYLFHFQYSARGCLICTSNREIQNRMILDYYRQDLPSEYKEDGVLLNNSISQLGDGMYSAFCQYPGEK